MALLLGESLQSTNTTGSLLTASQSVGNFKTLQLETQVGLWEIKMVSTNPYTLKVVGKNTIIMLLNQCNFQETMLQVTQNNQQTLFSVFHWNYFLYYPLPSRAGLSISHHQPNIVNGILIYQICHLKYCGMVLLIE